MGKKKEKVQAPTRIPLAPRTRNHGDKKKYDRRAAKAVTRRENAQ